MSAFVYDPGQRGPDPLLGQVVSDYRVVKEIGRGGMGAVYEAVHVSIGQRAAIKVLSADYADEPEYVDRFIAEARAASLVPHPGLVKIYNCGRCPDGSPYILMEFLPGESLRARQERLEEQNARVPMAEALGITRQIASALDAVHHMGIVHRDLKPGNIQLCPDPDLPHGDRVKVVDFGIAKITLAGEAVARHTTEGKFLGTAIYASPEQCMMEGNIGTPSDVYSLGVMLHEMLAGKPPFVAGTGAVMAMHIFKEPRPLRSLVPGMPEDLHQLVHRMLEKKPEQRPTMAEVVTKLDGIRLDRSVWSMRLRWHKRSIALATASLLTLTATGFVLRTTLRHRALFSLKTPSSQPAPIIAANPPPPPIQPIQPVAEKPIDPPPSPPPALLKQVKRIPGKSKLRHVASPSPPKADETAPPAPPAQVDKVAEAPPVTTAPVTKPDSAGETKHVVKKYQPIR